VLAIAAETPGTDAGRSQELQRKARAEGNTQLNQLNQLTN
jgi:hypothetical protein